MVNEPIRIPRLIPSKTLSHIHLSNFIDSNLSYVHLENKVTGEDTCVPTEPTLEEKANTRQLSPQRIKELDDIIASVHDNLFSDQPTAKKTLK